MKNLGMAQKQMVEIAKALTFDANILIFDEPTASLTEREVRALFQIIQNLKNSRALRTSVTVWRKFSRSATG